MQWCINGILIFCNIILDERDSSIPRLCTVVAAGGRGGVGCGCVGGVRCGCVGGVGVVGWVGGGVGDGWGVEGVGGGGDGGGWRGGWRDQNLYKLVGTPSDYVQRWGPWLVFFQMYIIITVVHLLLFVIYISIYIHMMDQQCWFSMYIMLLAQNLCLNWCCSLCYTHTSQTIGSIHNSNFINMR